MLASIRDDRDVFEAVTIDHEFGTIVVWPGDIDLDPDVLRGDEPPASGLALPRRVVQPAYHLLAARDGFALQAGTANEP